MASQVKLFTLWICLYTFYPSVVFAFKSQSYHERIQNAAKLAQRLTLSDQNLQRESHPADSLASHRLGLIRDLTNLDMKSVLLAMQESIENLQLNPNEWEEYRPRMDLNPETSFSFIGSESTKRHKTKHTSLHNSQAISSSFSNVDHTLLTGETDRKIWKYQGDPLEQFHRCYNDTGEIVAGVISGQYWALRSK